MSNSSYNLRNPGVKRLMKEAAELREPSELFYAQPLEDNLFEWHFTVRGPPDTDFAEGIYHGRIILPPEYPMKPPTIMLLTANGRFELNRKICLSISGHHPESWQPSWSIRTALLAIIGFMPTHGNGALGSLDYTPVERQKLAKKSQQWKCNECNVTMADVLPPITSASNEDSNEARHLVSQIQLKDSTAVNSSKDLNDVNGASSNSELVVNESGDTNKKDREDEINDGEEANGTRENNHVEGGSDVRRRLFREEIPRSLPDPVPVDQSLLSPPAPQSSPSAAWSYALLLISLIIGALVLRRLYIMNQWRFHH